jgi:hypothetical protein
VSGEIAVDRGLQVDEGTEHTTLQAAARELHEKTVDRIEPRRRNRGYDDGLLDRSTAH